MNIDEFAAVTKAEVDDFVENWKSQHAKGCAVMEGTTTTYVAAYPLEMPEGEWFDQFIMYLGTEQP